MTLPFLRAAGERATATFLQTYFAAFLVGDVALNAFAWSWGGPELGIALGAMILSLVKSLLGVLAPGDGPGWTRAEQIVAAPAGRREPSD